MPEIDLDGLRAIPMPARRAVSPPPVEERSGR
jgi:hypothetical protein